MKINIFEEFNLIGGQEIYAVKLLEMLKNRKNFTINFYTSIEGFNYIKSNYPSLSDALKILPENTINKIFTSIKSLLSEENISKKLIIGLLHK